MLPNLSSLRSNIPPRAFNAARTAWRLLKRVKTAYNIWKWNSRDAARYARFESSSSLAYSRTQHIAQITKAYHSLEKGLSLSRPRAGFGVRQALFLISLIESFLARYGQDEAIAGPVATLRSYLDYQQSVRNDFPSIDARLRDVERQMKITSGGGVIGVTKREITEAAKIDFKRFLDARHSIRSFSEEPVNIDCLIAATAMAQLAPSACNRQASRVHWFLGQDNVCRILHWQPGNRGFGHTAAAVAIVTARVDAYAGPEERRQPIVDGSLFAMTLVYALHSLGLGTCMLAWAASARVDNGLRGEGMIPDEEEIITLIAVGQLPNMLNVPVSNRFRSDAVARIA